MENNRSNKCTAFCQECGSDLCFSEDGCYCKGSFKKGSTCTWGCADCQPRKAVSK